MSRRSGERGMWVEWVWVVNILESYVNDDQQLTSAGKYFNNEDRMACSVDVGEYLSQVIAVISYGLVTKWLKWQ